MAFFLAPVVFGSWYSISKPVTFSSFPNFSISLAAANDALLSVITLRAAAPSLSLSSVLYTSLRLPTLPDCIFINASVGFLETSGSNKCSAMFVYILLSSSSIFFFTNSGFVLLPIKAVAFLFSTLILSKSIFGSVSAFMVSLIIVEYELRDCSATFSF